MIRRALEVRKLALRLSEICRDGEGTDGTVLPEIAEIADKLIEEVDG